MARAKENWFPGLIVAPNAQEIVKINTKVLSSTINTWKLYFTFYFTYKLFFLFNPHIWNFTFILTLIF